MPKRNLRIPHLRWWIGALLFASTTINYVDRQTLSVLAPYLKAEKHWTNTDFASIIIAFRISYSFLQFLGGRLIDLLGTRRGLAITVAWYSLMAMLTSLCRWFMEFSCVPVWVGYR
jgi:ACS family hexuronate transporter-like MFS transporter